MNKYIKYLIFIFLIQASVVFGQDSVEIKSGHGSAIGTTKILSLVPQASAPPPNPCLVGSIYTDDTNDLIYFCSGSPSAWGEFEGIWTQNADYLYPLGTTTDDMSIALGTTTPNHPSLLHLFKSDDDEKDLVLRLHNTEDTAGSIINTQITFASGDAANADAMAIKYRSSYDDADEKWIEFVDPHNLTVRPIMVIDAVKDIPNGAYGGVGINIPRNVHPSAMLEVRNSVANEPILALYDNDYPDPVVILDTVPTHAAGYLGIGTDTPSAHLEVHNDSSGQDIFGVYTGIPSNLEPVMIVKDDGKIGIEETDPEAQIHITNSNPYFWLSNGGGVNPNGDSSLILSGDDNDPLSNINFLYNGGLPWDDTTPTRAELKIIGNDENWGSSAPILVMHRDQTDCFRGQSCPIGEILSGFLQYQGVALGGTANADNQYKFLVQIPDQSYSSEGGLYAEDDDPIDGIQRRLTITNNANDDIATVGVNIEPSGGMYIPEATFHSRGHFRLINPESNIFGSGNQTSSIFFDYVDQVAFPDSVAIEMRRGNSDDTFQIVFKEDGSGDPEFYIEFDPDGGTDTGATSVPNPIYNVGSADAEGRLTFYTSQGPALAFDVDTGFVGLQAAPSDDIMRPFHMPGTGMFVTGRNNSTSAFGYYICTSEPEWPSTWAMWGGCLADSSSDIRLKENVQSLHGSLDKILKLKGVNFYWKDDDPFESLGLKTFGFIAQEAEPVFPSFVNEGKDGFLTFTKEALEPFFVEAIKELTTQTENQNNYIDLQVENLEKEIKANDAVITNNEKVINSLKKRIKQQSSEIEKLKQKLSKK